jgi:rhodanese-related sulfurtransferase
VLSRSIWAGRAGIHDQNNFDVAPLPLTDIASVRPRALTRHMDHAPGFLKVVNEARPRVKEITIEQAHERLKANPRAILIDVREDTEWNNGHALEARHLGKGVLERDIEKMIPDPHAEVIMYCGGGYRSVLTCEVAQRMGYRNVSSLLGGYKALVAANWPMKKVP